MLAKYDSVAAFIAYAHMSILICMQLATIYT